MTRQKRNKQKQGHGRVPGFPRLLGGRLCLDFINSIDGRIGPRPLDCLTDYAALVQWGYHVHLLTGTERGTLLQQAQEQHEDAKRVYSQAIALREGLYRIFVAILSQTTPPPQDLELLREVYVAGLGQARLMIQDASVSWHWPLTPDLRGVIWLVARSAVELLTAPELARVRQCPGRDDCGWLFLDTSKGGQRQWCSMEGCGSRVKMRRLYQRHHTKEGLESATGVL